MDHTAGSRVEQVEMGETETMRFALVVERRLVTQKPGLSFSDTPGTEYFHDLASQH
jgi:hypothetical protein